ncbi:LpqB family beta-propeller domain-containing protein [Psychromicrobium sp. YIM B11713]|uniref:LpqB family beta-propeller domain-containing protein n=1 Tax=Psychromicrobium sp. YIM B11713 TaxID=3145233 RepID=UPI00374F7777
MRTNVKRFIGMFALSALLLSGCASIPTGGDVGKVQNSPGSTSDDFNIGYTEQPPAPNASQQDIVRGFLDAATGVGNNFQVAKKYLTDAAAVSWDSSERTVVYQGTPEISATGGNSAFSAKLQVQSIVDASGILTPAPPRSTESLKFGLTKVDGQWRINSLPDGIALATNIFTDLFRHQTLYFYDPGFRYLVPDVRWLAGKGGSAAVGVVNALLNGPAPYLKGAVASAFPDGMRLESPTVPIENSIATVDLSAKPLLDASSTARLQMQTQLLATLQGGLNTVTGVQMRAGSDQIALGSAPQPADALRPAAVSSRLIGVANNDLAYLDGNAVGPIAGLASVAQLGPRSPAQTYQLFAEGGAVAFLDAAQNSLYTIAPGHTVVKPVTGQKLTPPSFSPRNWVWTAEGNGSGNVYAAHPGGQNTLQTPVVSLNVDWLKGRTVTSFRISRDGTRVLIASSSNGQTQLQLAGILRQDSTDNSAPRDLTPPTTIYWGSSAASLAYWAGENSIVLFSPGNGDVAPMDIELAKDSDQLPVLAAMQQLSVGNSPTDLYAVDAKGKLFKSSSSAWSESPTKGIQGLAFSG